MPVLRSEGRANVRVPPEVADRILDQLRPTLTPGFTLSRLGSHGVSLETAGHEVFGFVQSPWPFPPGPKRFRMKSALVDFTGSLCDLLSDATKHDWPGRYRVITVTTTHDHAFIEVTSKSGKLSLDVDTSLWQSNEETRASGREDSRFRCLDRGSGHQGHRYRVANGGGAGVATSTMTACPVRSAMTASTWSKPRQC